MSAMKTIRRATVAVGLSAVLLAPLAPAQAVSGPDPPRNRALPPAHRTPLKMREKRLGRSLQIFSSSFTFKANTHRGDNTPTLYMFYMLR